MSELVSSHLDVSIKIFVTIKRLKMEKQGQQPAGNAIYYQHMESDRIIKRMEVSNIEHVEKSSVHGVVKRSYCSDMGITSEILMMIIMILTASLLVFHSGAWLDSSSASIFTTHSIRGMSFDSNAISTVPTGTGSNEGAVILVTGATGRLGSKLYFTLKQRKENQQHKTTNRDEVAILEVRALVRSHEKAREVLGCIVCDKSEGIYIGDVTKSTGLKNATEDGKVTVLAIAVGASPYASKKMQRAVEFEGVLNSVRAIATKSSLSDEKVKESKNNSRELKVVLCSSMGTTNPPSDSVFGEILFWKLNAETFLSTAGLSSTTVVKPCGLKDGQGKKFTLYTGHLDEPSEFHTVSRDNVANIMTEAIVMATKSGNHHRFDLCSKPGDPTTDLKKVIEDSQWGWEKA